MTVCFLEAEFPGNYQHSAHFRRGRGFFFSFFSFFLFPFFNVFTTMSHLLLGVQENIIWTHDTSCLPPLTTSDGTSFSLLIIHLMSNSIYTPQALIIHWDLQSIHSSSIPLSVTSFSLSFLTKLMFLDHAYNLFLKASSTPHPSLPLTYTSGKTPSLIEPRYLPSPNLQSRSWMLLTKVHTWAEWFHCKFMILNLK